MVTLPYSPLSLLGNDFASKTVNPNPFVVFNMLVMVMYLHLLISGMINLIEPVVVDTNTDLFNIFLAKENVKESFSSLHNSFVINWVGTSSSFTAINSLGEC